MKECSTACPLQLKEQINRFQKVLLFDIASVTGYREMEQLLCYASSLLDPLLSDCFYNIRKLAAAGIQNCTYNLRTDIFCVFAAVYKRDL